MDYQVHLQKYAVAVKALIVKNPFKDDKILVLKNALDDPHRPGQADFPGGRLNPGEDPYLGLKRELVEELGAEFADTVQIGFPLDVAHFERPDGQVVTMIFFEAITNSANNVKLSNEHSSYEWLPLKQAGSSIDGKMLRAYERLAHPITIIK